MVSPKTDTTARYCLIFIIGLLDVLQQPSFEMTILSTFESKATIFLSFVPVEKIKLAM